MSNELVKLPMKSGKSKEPRVSCRVPRKLLTRLEKVAAQNGIDVSGLVRMSLYRVLPEYEKQEAA